LPGLRRTDDNSTKTSSTADCRRGLRLNVTLKHVDCTATHSDSPGGTTGLVCSDHGRCLAHKYYDVSQFYFLFINSLYTVSKKKRGHGFYRAMLAQSAVMRQ